MKRCRGTTFEKAMSKAVKAVSGAKKEAKKTYTLTCGDVSENHHGMQKNGELHSHGYSYETLCKVYHKLTAEGVACEMYALHQHYDGPDPVEEAWLLVIRKGVQHVLQTEDTVALMAENDALDMDKHALMKGRVVNKKARWNLCFDDEDQEPDYESGKGRIVAWKHIPLVSKIREWIAEITEDVPLKVEANYYYDIEKCGIGYHGDGERRKVFAMRMGASMPLYYQWYQRSEPVGPRMKFDLEDGDMYMMGEKAVGFDWLKRNVPTVRHATGCDRFTKRKP